MTPKGLNLKLSHSSRFQLFIVITGKVETFLKNGMFCNVHQNEVATSNETMNNLQKKSNLPTECRIIGQGTIMRHAAICIHYVSRLLRHI